MDTLVLNNTIDQKLLSKLALASGELIEDNMGYHYGGDLQYLNYEKENFNTELERLCGEKTQNLTAIIAGDEARIVDCMGRNVVESTQKTVYFVTKSVASLIKGETLQLN